MLMKKQNGWLYGGGTSASATTTTNVTYTWKIYTPEELAEQAYKKHNTIKEPTATITIHKD